MSASNASTCPSCGARVADGAGVCDLCGAQISAGDPDHRTPDEDPAQLEAKPSDSSPSEGDGSAGVYCNACGWENPSDARFCSQCGERLQRVDAPLEDARPVAAELPRGEGVHPGSEGSSATEDEETRLGWQVGAVVGIGVLLVVGLFLISSWSGSATGGSAAEEAGATPQAEGAPPMQSAPIGSGGAADLATLVERTQQAELPPQLAARTDSLRSVIERSSGLQQQAARRQLVNAFVGGGRLGPAAQAQKRIAETSGAAEDWRRTGDLLYSWMETLGDQPRSRSVAQHVVDAYQKVLDQNPGNLDVRTDMATAYLQTNTPMRGVEEINRVLEQDPDHFQARFNKGIMLTMIGRTDQAIEQFERVKEIVGSESPYYQQANQAIQTIREQSQPDPPSEPANPS